MLRAFGSRAQRWASHLPPDLPVIAVDESAIEAAYVEAVASRERAEPFFLWICIPEERALVARAFAPRAHDGRSFDERRLVYTQLAEGSLVVDGARIDQTRATLIVAAFPVLADLVRLADGLFAHSRAAIERWRRILPSKTAIATFAGPDISVPRPARRRSPATAVVWAPGRAIGELLIILNALEELRTPVVVVAEGHRILQPPGRRVPADLADVLADAAVIIDANDEEPSSALGLALLGVPLAVASTSGATEYLDGAESYDPWDWRSVFDATVRALGAPPPQRHDLDAIAARGRSTIAAASAPPPPDGPLVSVVIPTYCRRERLRGALAALQAQTYRNVEMIVVNDGGDPVDDVVAAFPRARYLSYDDNRGPEHALNVGFAAATGTYVTLLPDDDAFYPDHLARMVAACERTGAAIAHGNALVRFVADGPEGPSTTGFAADVFAVSLEKTEALYNSSVAGHAFVFRRDLAERIGWFDESLAVLGDQEFQTRLSAAADFAHVDHFTVEWRLTGGEANISTRKRALVPESMRRWYALHPTDRPAIEAQRVACLAYQDRGTAAFRPVIRLSAAERR